MAHDDPDAELLVRRLVADILVHARFAPLVGPRSPTIDRTLGSGNTGGGAKPASTELPDRVLDDREGFHRWREVSYLLDRLALVRPPGIADLETLFNAGLKLEREQPEQILAARVLATEKERREAAIGVLNARRRLLRDPQRPRLDRCTRAALAAELRAQAEQAPLSDTGRAELRERAMVAVMDPEQADAYVADVGRREGEYRARVVERWCPLTDAEHVRACALVVGVPMPRLLNIVLARARERVVAAARLWGFACGQDGAR